MRKLLLLVFLLSTVLAYDVFLGNVEPKEFTLGASKTIESQLEGKTPIERATIKGAEIAKIGALTRTDIGEYEAEIVSMSAIEGGVSVYARVWDGKGQIGFGDGTVDIEHFRIINPPILVPDPNGTIVRVSHSIQGTTSTTTYREDPQAALFEALNDSLERKTQKFSGEKIETGKIGNTTTTVYSNAGGDGMVGKNDGGSWAANQGSASGNFNDNAQTLGDFVYSYGTGSFQILRVPVPFDTSGIPDGDSITSATVTIKFSAASGVHDDALNVNLVTTTQASGTAIANADYGTFGTSKASDTDLLFSSIGASTYDFVLNATGLASISKTGYTKLGFRTDADRTNTAPTGTNWNNTWYAADDGGAGTTNDPKLVIESSPAANFAPWMMFPF